MARMENQPQSRNIEDRTGDNIWQKALTKTLYDLNPLYAARKVRGVLIDKGIIEPQVHDFFGHKDFLDQIEAGIRAQTLPNYGLTPQEMDVILKRMQPKEKKK